MLPSSGVAVKYVRADYVADLIANIAHLFNHFDCLAQELKGRDRGKGPRQLILCTVVRIGTCAHRQYDIADLQIRMNRASRADTDDIVDVIKIKQLIGINIPWTVFPFRLP